MTWLIMPTVACNITCSYCMEAIARGEMSPYTQLKYDLQKMKASILYAIEKYGVRHFTLHGGEPLLTKLQDIEDIAQFLAEHGCQLGIQTNGLNITPRHIEVFKKYNMEVGVSLDGPPELNWLRGYWKIENGQPVPDLEKSRIYTERVEENVDRCLRSGLQIGFITILHRVNAAKNVRETLFQWLDRWIDRGIRSFRLNPMYATDNFMEQYQLSCEELYDFFTTLWYRRKPGVFYGTLDDIIKVLMGDIDNSVCWFGGCSYWHSFVWTISNTGEIQSCDRTLASGAWLRDGDNLLHNDVRTQALLATELKNARYAHLHKGGCPAEGPKGEWRKASRFTQLWEKLFSFVEQEIKKITPNLILTSELDRYEYLERTRRGERWDAVRRRWLTPVR